MKGECDIRDIGQKEQGVKQKTPASRFPENAPRQAAADAAQKLRQLIRTAEHGGSALHEQSAERRAEDQAGETVRETASMTVYGVESTARFASSAVRRLLESGHTRGPKGKAGKGADGIPPAGNTAGEALSHGGDAFPEIPSPQEVREAACTERGRELARTRTRECVTARKQEQLRWEKHGGSVPQGKAEQTKPRIPKSRRNMPAQKPRKPTAPRLRDTSALAAKSAQTASVPAQRARLRAMRGGRNPRSTARGIRGAAQKLAAGFKAAASTLRSLPAALVAGGAAAVTVVLLVCLIALVAGSSFGIFFAAQPTGSGESLQTVVRQLSDDYYAQIEAIEQNIPHDRLEVIPDGPTAIRWQEVLSVFAADMAAAENGQPVAVLETAQAAIKSR